MTKKQFFGAYDRNWQNKTNQVVRVSAWELHKLGLLDNLCYEHFLGTGITELSFPKNVDDISDFSNFMNE